MDNELDKLGRHKRNGKNFFGLKNEFVYCRLMSFLLCFAPILPRKLQDALVHSHCNNHRDGKYRTPVHLANIFHDVNKHQNCRSIYGHFEDTYLYVCS